MPGFSDSGLTMPMSPTSKTGWEDLMVDPNDENSLVEVPQDVKEEVAAENAKAAEYSDYVSSAVENGHFVSEDARWSSLDAFRRSLEYNADMTTFTLFAAPGYEFPSMKDPSFDAAMEDPSHWLPERVALQQESIDHQVTDALRLSESLRAKERERGVGPTIYALRGVSAAGKTQAIKRIPGAIVENGFTVGALAPDTSKRDLYLASGGVTDQIHKESSMMTRRVEKALKSYALEGELSDIRDRVLKDQTDVIELIDDATETGRRIEMIDIDVPLEVSAMRLLLREKGGADPNPNPNYLRDKAFSGVRSNRLRAIEQLKEAYTSGRVSDVAYTLLCYDYESEPKEIQREAYKLWVDTDTGELKEEILNQELFDNATKVTDEELDVLSRPVTLENVDAFCKRYFNDDENSQKYAQEMRNGVAGYFEKDPPITLYDALAEKNKVEKKTAQEDRK